MLSLQAEGANSVTLILTLTILYSLIYLTLRVTEPRWTLVRHLGWRDRLHPGCLLERRSHAVSVFAKRDGAVLQGQGPTFEEVDRLSGGAMAKIYSAWYSQRGTALALTLIVLMTLSMMLAVSLAGVTAELAGAGITFTRAQSFWTADTGLEWVYEQAQTVKWSQLPGTYVVPLIRQESASVTVVKLKTVNKVQRLQLTSQSGGIVLQAEIVRSCYVMKKKDDGQVTEKDFKQCDEGDDNQPLIELRELRNWRYA